LRERDARFAQITIARLVSMTSGLRYEDNGLPWSDDTETYYGTDVRKLALTDTEIIEPPGTRWHYNNYNSLLLGMILFAELAPSSAPPGPSDRRAAESNEVAGTRDRKSNGAHDTATSTYARPPAAGTRRLRAGGDRRHPRRGPGLPRRLCR
jgi:hypothetical protein